jgi:predicted nuclease with TOPRIM domain
MYGDSAAIRRRVRQLREQAVDVRALADRLVAQADAIDWQGRAADAMRERIRDRAEHLRDCAHRHDNAAEALDRHNGEVGLLKESISEVEHKASSLVADARTRVARIEAHDDPDGVVRQATPEDRKLADFTAPPSGHKDWLTVELPGL